MIQIAVKEAELYYYHSADTSGNNGGWLPLMGHSITQQLLRRDPIAYLQHILLRKDKETCMVSKPCPDVYMVPGEKYKSYMSFGDIDPVTKANGWTHLGG